MEGGTKGREGYKEERKRRGLLHGLRRVVPLPQGWGSGVVSILQGGMEGPVSSVLDHWRSQRGPTPLPPQRMRKISKLALKLTLNMRYKICHHPIRFFFKLKVHQNLFSAPPRTHSPPRSTPSASQTRRLGSQAPQHKILAMPVY